MKLILRRPTERRACKTRHERSALLAAPDYTLHSTLWFALIGLKARSAVVRKYHSMCLSPATLNLREARQLEWETLGSDEEDELPSSWTGLGLPAIYLDSSETDDSPSTSSSREAALFPHFTQAHRLAAEVDHQLKQLQLVGAGCRPCLASI